MKIIDAHHHLWDLQSLPYPWLQPDAGPRPFGNHSAIKCDYRIGNYAADIGFELIGSVHIQANTGAPDPVTETEWVFEETQDGSWPVAIVGEVRLDDSSAETTTARHARFTAFRGVRVFAGYDDDPVWRQCSHPKLLLSPAVHILAEALSHGGHSLDVVVHTAQLPHVSVLAGEFPELPIVVNHLGQPRTSDFAAAGLWREGIAQAAAAPNVCAKLSGLWTIDRDWTPDILAPFVQHVVSQFGASRCMYGSNLPIEKVMLSPQLQVPRLLAALGRPSDAETDAILRGTAARVYRL